jgi:hypothetical protein
MDLDHVTHFFLILMTKPVLFSAQFSAKFNCVLLVLNKPSRGGLEVERAPKFK